NVTARVRHEPPPYQDQRIARANLPLPLADSGKARGHVWSSETPHPQRICLFSGNPSRNSHPPPFSLESGNLSKNPPGIRSAPEMFEPGIFLVGGPMRGKMRASRDDRVLALPQ